VGACLVPAPAATLCSSTNRSNGDSSSTQIEGGEWAACWTRVALGAELEVQATAATIASSSPDMEHVPARSCTGRFRPALPPSRPAAGSRRGTTRASRGAAIGGWSCCCCGRGCGRRRCLCTSSLWRRSCALSAAPAASAAASSPAPAPATAPALSACLVALPFGPCPCSCSCRCSISYWVTCSWWAPAPPPSSSAGRQCRQAR
jgi:hypothetical protein